MKFVCYNCGMKLIRTFAITSKEFYDYLENALMEEIAKNTNKKPKRNVIKKGFTYENKNAKSKIVIDEYVRGHSYHSTVRSATSFIHVRYETEETEEGLKISFEQVMSGDENIPNKNVLYRTWYNWITFGRMSHTLYDMRDAIIKIRNGESPQKASINYDSHQRLKKYLTKKVEEQE